MEPNIVITASVVIDGEVVAKHVGDISELADVVRKAEEYAAMAKKKPIPPPPSPAQMEAMGKMLAEARRISAEQKR